MAVIECNMIEIGPEVPRLRTRWARSPSLRFSVIVIVNVIVMECDGSELGSER